MITTKTKTADQIAAELEAEAEILLEVAKILRGSRRQ